MSKPTLKVDLVAVNHENAHKSGLPYLSRVKQLESLCACIVVQSERHGVAPLLDLALGSPQSDVHRFALLEHISQGIEMYLRHCLVESLEGRGQRVLCRAVF